MIHLVPYFNPEKGTFIQWLNDKQIATVLENVQEGYTSQYEDVTFLVSNLKRVSFDEVSEFIRPTLEGSLKSILIEHENGQSNYVSSLNLFVFSKGSLIETKYNILSREGLRIGEQLIEYTGDVNSAQRNINLRSHVGDKVIKVPAPESTFEVVVEDVSPEFVVEDRPTEETFQEAYDAMIKSLEVVPLTSNVPVEERKYLSAVAEDEDVFFDSWDASYSDNKLLIKALKSKDLPYQYSKDGDLLLNHKGAILRKSFYEDLDLLDKLPTKSRGYLTWLEAFIHHYLADNYGLTREINLTNKLVANVTSCLRLRSLPSVSEDYNFSEKISISTQYLLDELVNFCLTGRFQKYDVLFFLVDYSINEMGGVFKFTQQISRLDYAKYFV